MRAWHTGKLLRHARPERRASSKHRTCTPTRTSFSVSNSCIPSINKQQGKQHFPCMLRPMRLVKHC